ncbi:MAG: hypothetical protein PHH26_05085 [Candidatus Thermoplasmatota archaeon]|nr:hypothetical protein [Candidatus Thermoplasmatota archaeon]
MEGSTTEMIHKDDMGRLFVGPPLNSTNVKTIVVEIGDGKPKDGYLRILDVVGYIY